VGKLVLFLADGTTTDVPLDRERITIGRRVDNDVCLPYPAVSGEHAAVVTILADSFLEDLGSTNGTLVNGRPVTKHILADRDLIDIGRQRFTYLADDDAKVDPLPPDIARKLLRGLSELVEPARPLPQVAVPPQGDRRPQFGARGTPRVANVDPDREAPGPAAAEAPSVGRARESFMASGDAAPPIAGSTTLSMPERAHADSGSSLPPRIARTDSPSTAPRVVGRAGSSSTQPPGVVPSARETLGYAKPRMSGAALLPTASPAADPASNQEPQRGPAVRVLSGPSSGRVVAFRGEQLTVGRVGLQVAAVRKVADGFLLVPVEGALPPRINGVAVETDGSPLRPGDTFEVAGVRLELSVEC
jgi:hypothetical protein